MTEIKKDILSFQSRCIDTVRVLFVLILVLFHGFATSPSGFSFGNYPITEIFKRFVDTFFGDSIVAVYFFISGYLFFWGKDWTSGVYKEKLKRRVKTLFIPYVLWNLLGVCLVIVRLLPVFNTFLAYPGSDLNLSVSNFLSCFWMYDGQLGAPSANVENYEILVQRTSFPINTALWFVRDLMIVVVCTPLVYFLLKRLRTYFLMLLSALYLFFSYYVIDWHINQLLMAFLFFSWGAHVCLRKNTVLDYFSRSWPIWGYLLCSILFLLVSYFAIKEISPLFKVVHSFVTVAFAFNIGGRLSRHGIMQFKHGAAWSCFIYMSHCLVLPRLLKVVAFAIAPVSDLAWLLTYILSVFVALALLSLCFVLCRKYMPKLLNILIGGRVR